MFSDVGSDTDTETDTEIDTETDTETDIETNADTEPDMEPETGISTEPGSETTDAADGGDRSFGCGASAGLGGLMMVAVLAFAGVAIRKKKTA